MRCEMTSCMCHGNSYLGSARQGREFEKDLRVGGMAGGFLQSGVIADGFAQVREFALEPPAQRTKPENGRVQTGQGLKVEVALPHMGAFVGQDDAQLLGVPLVVIGGQDHGRAHRDRGRDSAAAAQAQSRRPNKSPE